MGYTLLTSLQRLASLPTTPAPALVVEPAGVVGAGARPVQHARASSCDLQRRRGAPPARHLPAILLLLLLATGTAPLAVTSDMLAGKQPVITPPGGSIAATPTGRTRQRHRQRPPALSHPHTRSHTHTHCSSQQPRQQRGGRAAGARAATRI